MRGWRSRGPVGSPCLASKVATASVCFIMLEQDLSGKPSPLRLRHGVKHFAARNLRIHRHLQRKQRGQLLDHGLALVCGFLPHITRAPSLPQQDSVGYRTDQPMPLLYFDRSLAVWHCSSKKEGKE